MAFATDSTPAPTRQPALLRRLASALAALAAEAPDLPLPPLLRPAPIPALVPALARRRAVFGPVRLDDGCGL